MYITYIYTHTFDGFQNSNDSTHIPAHTYAHTYMHACISSAILTANGSTGAHMHICIHIDTYTHIRFYDFQRKYAHTYTHVRFYGSQNSNDSTCAHM